MGKRWAYRVAFVLAVLAAVAAVIILSDAVIENYCLDVVRNHAALQTQKIEQAIRSYRDQTGVYPVSLDQLVTESKAGPPYLEGGESGITDPWGKRFRFEVAADGRGGERVVVWTTDDRGRRIQWPRE